MYFEPGGKQYKAIYNEGLEVEHLANVDSAWAYIRNGTTEGYIARSNLRGFEENSAASKATPKPTLRPTPKPTAKPTQAPAKSAYTAPYSETPVPTQAPQKKTYNYILNKNTGKFHYPSCSSVKQMKESNKVYFEGDRDEAMSRGYVPCKKCYP